jgi:hypothetical protein
MFPSVGINSQQDHMSSRSFKYLVVVVFAKIFVLILTCGADLCSSARIQVA